MPTFNGNILIWTTFWEQFAVAVHGRSSLSNSGKLAYLCHAVKSGTTKGVIEGLSRSGDHYSEAVEPLKSRYNRPRLIHVRKILEAQSLKDGNGRELRRLHDLVQQHLRALKALGQEPSGPFITSLIELKLDSTTMFEWHHHSQESAEVPYYQELLDLINLRAQPSEASTSDTAKKPLKTDCSLGMKGFYPSRSVTVHATNANAPGNCVLCKSEKHPLYVCPQFKALSHEAKMNTLKSNGLCVNCMCPGHFVKGCKSLHRCHVCQKPHHSLLHIEAQPPIVLLTPFQILQLRPR